VKDVHDIQIEFGGWKWSDILAEEYIDFMHSSVFFEFRSSAYKKNTVWPMIHHVILTQWEPWIWMGIIITGVTIVDLNWVCFVYLELSEWRKYVWKAEDQPCWLKWRWNAVSVKAILGSDDWITERNEWIIESLMGKSYVSRSWNDDSVTNGSKDPSQVETSDSGVICAWR